jgi:hypothetical protein
MDLSGGFRPSRSVWDEVNHLGSRPCASLHAQTSSLDRMVGKDSTAPGDSLGAVVFPFSAPTEERRSFASG